MKSIATIIAVLLFFLALPLLLPKPQNDQATQGLPWQIEVAPDGTALVSGLTLGRSTLADALRRFGDDAELAIVAAPGETGTLELYFANASMGNVTGKLVVTAQVTEDELLRLQQNAAKAKYMQSSTKKAALDDADLPFAYSLPIRALAMVPTANLNEEILIQRFGQPAERIRTSAEVEHWLYPQQGLDITLNAKSKELLQYVAPRDFQQLREPLLTTPQTAQ